MAHEGNKPCRFPRSQKVASRAPLSVSAMLVALGALIVNGCASAGSEPSPQTSANPAPEFSLSSMDSRKVALSEFRGKVVVVDFWATWCPACRGGLTHLQALATDPKLAAKGLVVLAVNERENSRDIRSFLEASHISLTVLQDVEGSASRAFSVSVLPTTILIGRDGAVRCVISEFSEESARELDAAIAKAI